MKYKVGDKVKLKSKEGLDELKRQVGDLYISPKAYKNAGSEQTILECNEGFYRYDASPKFWHESVFEGLVEEETKPKYEDEVNGEYYSTPKYLVRPSGYQFVDENGNIINAMKIVLEKKKKEYPKTYVECYEIMYGKKSPFHSPQVVKNIGYKGELFTNLQRLIFYRDAYWKIAGEEMGLDKPWEPDWTNDNAKYSIYTIKGVLTKAISCYDGAIFVFPTEEMRDAFYENFKEIINECKELL